MIHTSLKLLENTIETQMNIQKEWNYYENREMEFILNENYSNCAMEDAVADRGADCDTEALLGGEWGS